MLGRPGGAARPAKPGEAVTALGSPEDIRAGFAAGSVFR